MSDMEGKDLALEKKIEVLEKFEADVIKAIKDAEKNKDQNNELTIRNFQLQYKKVNGKYEFSFNGSKIFELDEKDKFRYDLENIKKIDEEIKKNNKETDRPAMESLEKALGIPETEDLKEIQEKREKEEKAKGEKAPEDKGAEEKADKEKPELNKEEQEKDAKQQVAKRNGVSASKIIEINLYCSISEHNGGLINQLPKLREQVEKEGKEGRFFVVERDDYEYDLLMEDHKTGEIIDLNENQKAFKKVEGTNPNNEKIILSDSKGKMSEVVPKVMYMDNQDNRVGYAVAYDEHGRLQPMEIRRLDNDQYTATLITTIGFGNTDMVTNKESANFTDRTQGNDDEVKEKIERFYQAKNDKELPHDANPAKDEDGIHMDEVKTAADLKEARIKAIEEELKSKDGVDFPGKAKEIATKMVEKMYDSNGEATGVSYDDAKQQAMESGKEQGGRTQGEERKDPRRG